MKKLLSLAVLASAMSLTACGGGSSDSSGSSTTTTTTTPTTTTTTSTTTTTPATGNACEINGSNVYATTTGCTYSNASMNNGASVTYTCTADSRIQATAPGLNLNSKSFSLNGMAVICKP